MAKVKKAGDRGKKKHGVKVSNASTNPGQQLIIIIKNYPFQILTWKTKDCFVKATNSKHMSFVQLLVFTGLTHRKLENTLFFVPYKPQSQ